MMVTIVGAGLGKIELLSQLAREKIQAADLVIATDRLYEKFCSLNKNSLSLPLSKIGEQIKMSQDLQNIVLLASGDVGFYSISKSLKDILSGHEIEFITGTSSLQYLASKLQISYENIKTVSVHGREQSAIPFVCYNERIFLLTGGKYKAHDVIEQLISSGLGEVAVTVGENLSDENERILTGKATELQGVQFDNLSVLLVENQGYVNRDKAVFDSDFVRSNVPMTKEDIRFLSLSILDIQPTDIVYDVGAGTGSVAIGMAYRASESFVYGIEKNEAAITLIHQNREKLGAYNLCVLNAKAPEGIAELPSPNKVFIGGSSGNLKEIFELLLKKNPAVKIVVNAITLQTLSEAISCFEEHQMKTSIRCINSSVSEKIGRYDMMKAQNPIYIISGEHHG